LKCESMTAAKRSKRPYRKSTPIGRLRRNVDKVSQHASLLRSRVASWSSADERVAEVEKLAASVVSKAAEVDELLADLEDTGFVPPEKARVVTWTVGQRVGVGKKFRAKYETAYHSELERDPGYLDVLVVESVLDSGEIAVRRKGRSPFLVPKTHLVGVEEASGG
jgi:hypothetical protein